MPKGLILIAEDDVNLSEILKTKLSAMGYDVIVAHDGEEAEKIMQESRPDLCMLDVMMPKKNGMEVLETKSKNPQIESLPVIMVSNLGQQKDIDSALKLGAKDYLVKANVSLAQIVDKIDQFLKANPPKERPAAPAAPVAAPPKPAQTPTAAPAPVPTTSTVAVPQPQTQPPQLPQQWQAAAPQPYQMVYLMPPNQPPMYYYLVPAFFPPPSPPPPPPQLPPLPPASQP